jgi:hypothetical protein
MAIEQYGFDDQSYVAGADLRLKQYYILEEANTGAVTVTNAATDRPVGVLQNKPNTGEAAQVRQTGITKCVSDGTTPIAIGDPVGTNNAGKCIKKSTDKDIVIGYSKSASSADGVVISVDMSFKRDLAV